MKLVLVRDDLAQAYTAGQLTIDGTFQCFTLEPPTGDYGEDCAIPLGTYPVQIRWSQKFHAMIPHVDQVPGRSAIEIHTGNTIHDTEGCILVGQTRLPGGVITHSAVTRQAVQTLIAQAQARGESVTLTVDETRAA